MEKFLSFLKTLGSFVVIVVLLLALFIGVIGELFPAVIPDWMYVVGLILCIPFWIAFFVVVFKEWKKQRKAKKSNKRCDTKISPQKERIL